MIRVVAALIEKEDKVFIARRSTGDPNVLGKWEFPGGKVEPGEDELFAIEREIKEELNINIKANYFMINNVCEYPHKTIDLRLYNCTYNNGDLNLNDHSEYKWVLKEELLDYDLAKADIPLAKYIINS